MTRRAAADGRGATRSNPFAGFQLTRRREILELSRRGKVVSATVRATRSWRVFQPGVVVGFVGSLTSSASQRGPSGSALFVVVSLFSVVLSTSAPTTASAQPGPDQSGRIPVELVPASPRSDTSVPGLIPAPAAPKDQGIGKPPPAPEQPVPPRVTAPVDQTKVPKLDVGPVGEVVSAVAVVSYLATVLPVPPGISGVVTGSGILYSFFNF